ncbi:MAG: hypothetical protein ACFE8P_12770, partial [Promethearchaeota archaeon]
ENLFMKIAKKEETIENIPEIRFLIQLGFLKNKTTISEKGKLYFTKKYVLNDYEESKAILINAIKQIPACIAICESLFGRKDLKKENIFNLLLVYDLIDANSKLESISGFIMLLNYCGLISYSKKTGLIRINYNPFSCEELPRNIFISPETPFSNLIAIRKIIRNSSVYINWVAKHLGKKALEILAEEVDGNDIQEINLLSSINVSEDLLRFRSDFKKFKEEMKSKGINANLRIIVDKTIINQLHDRWFITKGKCFNIPPLNSLLQGQHCEIFETDSMPPFVKLWNQSKNIISEWNIIEAISRKK